MTKSIGICMCSKFVLNNNWVFLEGWNRIMEPLGCGQIPWTPVWEKQ